MNQERQEQFCNRITAVKVLCESLDTLSRVKGAFYKDMPTGTIDNSIRELVQRLTSACQGIDITFPV